ncbi:hypothetical protein F443_18271 [Phytophthora nicotianae P1569]|uniref:Uncharacterized protein n=1 Tax=Phytophthora nicotianae P1569 TaxID=1317065 RepID=V9E8R9_PHYNI|nr:hypothetical protein F443_18271 [Phytophthora nicotianae P1569]
MSAIVGWSVSATKSLTKNFSISSDSFVSRAGVSFTRMASSGVATFCLVCMSGTSTLGVMWRAFVWCQCRYWFTLAWACTSAGYRSVQPFFSARYCMMALPSKIEKSPSCNTGMRPFGLSFKNSGDLKMAEPKSAATNSWSSFLRRKIHSAARLGWLMRLAYSLMVIVENGT